MLNFYNFLIVVLVFFDHLIKGYLILSNKDLTFVALSLALTPISLVFKRNINHVLFFRKGVSITCDALTFRRVGQRVVFMALFIGGVNLYMLLQLVYCHI